MPKRFLFFTKGQRAAIAVLLVLIVAVVVADYTLTRWAKQPATFYNDEFAAEVQLFEEKMDSLRAAEKKVYEKSHFAEQKTKKEKAQPVYFAFDPNTLDSTGFVALGLKPWTAANIVKYRARGGLFRTKNDFAKIYGVTSEQFAALEPFIQIAELPKNETTETAMPDIVVELNTADTAQLATVAGRGLAKRIVSYRKMLGGYHSTAQLSEVYDMTNEKLTALLPHLTIDTTKIRRINVNRASVEQLKRHPYINFYQAKAIYELRRAKQRLNAIDELRHLEEFSPADIEKLTHYLSFE